MFIGPPFLRGSAPNVESHTLNRKKSMQFRRLLPFSTQKRRHCWARHRHCGASLDTARAAVESLLTGRGGYSVLPTQEYRRKQ